MVQIESYTSINDVPKIIWNGFVNLSTVNLEIGHLLAIEVSQINDIHPYYLIGYSNKKPVGIAYCFAIQVDLAGMSNDYPPEILETVKTWKPDFMEVRIVELGHIASLGNTIEFLQKYRVDFFYSLSQKIDEIGQLENADLCIVRDIPSSRYNEFNVLKEYGYQPALGFPTARMPLYWNNFNGYLNSLKSKKRNNIKQKRRKLKNPELSVKIINDYAPYSERLAELWTNVAKHNNGYQHERLTPAYFEAMNIHMNGRSHVVAIKKNNKIIAYGLNLIGNDEYFGVAEGLDYSLRDEFDLYANNIFEGINIACELQKKIFNIGITSYNFKTFIGAELESNIYFLKAFKKKSYTAVYADFIQKNITQPTSTHQAFKGLNKHKSSQLINAKTLLNDSENTLDPFTRHYNYSRVDAARSADLYPFCPVFESAQKPIIKHLGRDVVLLGTNSYLGLATHPKIKEAAHKAIKKYGVGCSGSPLLNGTLDLHNKLRCELAHFMGKQDALIFSTGYQTNIGVISALVNRNDVLIMDERNHASLIDGARLSGARLIRYKHNDMASLETALKRFAHEPKLVVSDTIFSMKGTMIDLPKMVQLVKQYDARLMLDESHAIGVVGENGRGIAEYYGLSDEVDILMGTFSKSLASIGGFVAGDYKLLDTLKHIARSHVFSASLPPASVAAVLAALDIVKGEPERQIRLHKNAKYLAKGLQELGFTVNYKRNAIIPLFCGHELLAVAAYQKLLKEGVYVNIVTYPAVPKNEELLRISVMATHDVPMLNKALDVFKKIRTPNWPA